MVHVCSVEEKRCPFFSRTILKKFNDGCERFFSMNELPTGAYELPPPVAAGTTAADVLDGA